MRKRWVKWAFLAIVFGWGAIGLLAQSAPAPPLDPTRMPAAMADFPAADGLIWSLELEGLRAKLATRRLAEAPNHPDTVRLLMAARRYDDALRVTRGIVESHPDDIAAAFVALGASSLREMLWDGARNYRDALRTLAADAHQRVASLPTNQAAEAASALVGLDSELQRPDSRSWYSALGAFIANYPASEPALLAQVDLLTERIGPPMLDAIDSFAREHPGTKAAAKAMYMKAFHLSHNAFSFGERARQDPTDRFFRIVSIVDELRSGRYPQSEWVEKAPKLVAEFSTYQPVYAAGNADRVLTAMEESLPSLLESYERDPLAGSLSFVVGTKMGELFKTKGDPVPGIEGVFERLAAKTRNPDAVRMAEAEFNLRPPEQVVDANDRPALRAKGQATLERLVKDGSAVYRRRALATLARSRFGDGDYAGAGSLYQQFVDRYADSEYAWVAALRVGLCEELLGQSPTAIASFERASERFKSNPIALVLGRAYAGRSAEAVGDFSRALSLYRTALAAWDADFGFRYTLYSTRFLVPGDMMMRVDDTEVTRPALTLRIEELRNSLAAEGGELVERGRRLIQRARWTEARAPLTQFVAQHPKSPLLAEARFLDHRARLELALELADSDKGPSRPQPAIEALRELSADTPDFGVCAAKIALATLTFLSRSEGDSDAMMADAIRLWQALDAPKQSGMPSSDLLRDVLGIRNAVFRPAGDGVFRTRTWNAFNWEASTASYFVVDPELRVKASAGEIETIVTYQPFPEFRNVVFLGARERELLERIMLRLGGTKHHPWTEVMQTPNQPAGDSLRVLAFWKKSFWAQPGHWGGWVLTTYPIVTEIEFIDAERTKAAVKVTVGYSGATVQMEKRDGVWVARELTNFWVT